MDKHNNRNKEIILPLVVGFSAALSCAYLLMAAFQARTVSEPAGEDNKQQVREETGEEDSIDQQIAEKAILEEKIGEKHLAMNRADRLSLFDRYRLPELSRMDSKDEAEMVLPRQSIKRMEVLKLDPRSLEFPEADYKLLYNSVLYDMEHHFPGVIGYSQQKNAPDTPGPSIIFEGKLASELNSFLRSSSTGRVIINSREIQVDEPICLPSNMILDGKGVELVPYRTEAIGDAAAGQEAEATDRAILLDRVKNSAVLNFVINGGFKYGIFVKHSESFAIVNNDISEVSIKGVAIIGDNHDFYLGGNRIHENMDGGLYLDGNIYRGVIEDNQIVNNLGAANLSAGMVLCSIDIKDEDTAWNPWEDVYIYDITESPHELVVINNTIQGNRSSGCYSHAGYTNYFVQNRIIKNEKEGMCLDYGSVGNYVAFNIIRANGGRFRMSADDLKRDFIEEFGHLPDGSSPAKLPGLSLDNSSYNTIYQNIVADNYGSGVKAVRSSYRNTILCNEITDNNQGVSDQFHFFGVELATDMNADEEVKGLDFTPCYENIVARNTISGPHFAGIFYGTDAYVNDSFDNVIMGATNWSIESLSGRFNSVINNPSDCEMRIPAVLEGEKHE